MTRKFPICPDRIRTIPEQFSWVDHRLVRDHHIELLSHEAAALYLFLVTVADCQGLSYYSDVSMCERLTMDTPTLADARICLGKAGLVAYKKPLYQVLALADRTLDSKKRSVTGEPMAIAEIFKGLVGGVR
ncbi:MAG: hypothetical protein P4L50_06990 [Anaerolineaceae bacterium]|nr:hypothetical protein [Anaerolineaceae bacterium]